jgi:TonB dependent receptor/TonB-dependent Receptor Plug Domain
MRPSGRFGSFLVMGLFMWAASVLAQDLVAPKVKLLPAVQVPTGVEVPESGVVRVMVRIDADGKGVVEKCAAGRALCDLLIEAIERADFEPATRDGIPVPSQVRVDLRVRQSASDEASSSAPPQTVLEPGSAEVEKELVFSETAEVDARVQVPIRLELDGIRNIPGTLGEPFRILEMLPGTVPVANGQPYVYVRGAPPSGTRYLYDDIPVPLLFHSALLPSTLHPGLIGGIDLFSGAAPARYGRFTGGVMAARAREIPDDQVHGEAELRAIDVSGLLNVPMPKEGSMTFAGRYGFPNLLLGAINVDAEVDYWDYQYRTGVAMSSRSRFEVVAFGGRDDSVFDASDPDQRLAFDLQFHRMEARFLGKVKRWDLLGTLLYGYDFSEIDDRSLTAVSNAGANIHRFGPRFSATYGAPKVQVRVGGDVSGLFGPAECTEVERDVTVDEIPNLSTPCDRAFAQQDRRVIGGAFVDTNIATLAWLDLSLGLRVDVWGTAGYREAGVGPRARATFHAREVADFFVGWGLGFMPATFAIPLPGLGDIPLEPVLQRANQTDGGIRFLLPYELTLETRGYLNLYQDLRFVDIFTNPGISNDPRQSPFLAGNIDDSAEGKSYGFELLVQRPFDAGLSTLVSYTLGYSDLTATALLSDGPSQTFDYTPSYDVRHVMNAVLAWQAKFGLIIAGRLFARSGRAEGWLWLDEAGVVQQYVQRVPWFVRLDAQIAYEWAKPGRRMRIGLEWINITQAKDAQEIDSSDPNEPPECLARWGVPAEPCPIKYTRAIWFPNLSFRAVF